MSKYIGSCLCGKILYEINGEIRDLLNCHCSDCRKSHGAAFRTRAAVDANAFTFLSGEDLLTRYEHKAGEFRSFCSRCGSNIATFFSDPTSPIGLALGTLDSPLSKGPEFHVFTSEKASWHTITDDLPQFPRFAPLDMENAEQDVDPNT